MNTHSSAHEVPQVPHLFIDAFRGKYLSRTSDARNTFVLTHYHGDHYGSLPRDNHYSGPARIHCTPITARLLTQVHGVAPEFVVPHEYGDTWALPVAPAQGDQTQDSHRIDITFYDANHCPGAAIIIIERYQSEQDASPTVFCHTGDFRYHSRMQTYPRLCAAATQHTIDTLLLDTTYAHPKHNFAAQETVIQTIAAQVHERIDGATLVLLECYNIGKERILGAVADRCRVPLYVSERKWKLLACLAAPDEITEEDATGTGTPNHARLLQYCTRDPHQTDVHVVPMATTGELWPFFQPNYESIADYVEQQAAVKKYGKVVSFIPTGWAEATNWNRKHACTRMTRRGLDIEIRLVAYSEHSSFAELKEFVEFAKPRRIVATVYKDERDKRNIEARFPVDRTRAKKRFLEQMSQSNGLKRTAQMDLLERGSTTTVVETSTMTRNPHASPEPSDLTKPRVLIEIDDSDSQPAAETTCNKEGHRSSLAHLLAMGFSKLASEQALEHARHDLETAVHWLLQRNVSKQQTAVIPAGSSQHVESPQPKPGTSSGKRAKTKLTAFFARKT